MTKVKMCGLFRDEDIQLANEAKPDFIGFVFYKKSSRCVDKETAKRLRSSLDSKITVVGVFVDEDISFIKKLVEENIIDNIQLHGHENGDYIRQLRKSFVLNSPLIIRAEIIKTSEDIVRLHEQSSLYDASNGSDSELSLPDYYLLDSGMGSGSSFDWNLLKELNRPIFLAGGLTPENVKEAIYIVKPFAVDVSSGIETNKVKDIAKMKRFIENVRL